MMNWIGSNINCTNIITKRRAEPLREEHEALEEAVAASITQQQHEQQPDLLPLHWNGKL
jgi:hypothetical protein